LVVDATSAVSVLVIDCTTTGALPPTATPPTCTCRVCRRGAGAEARGVARQVVVGGGLRVSIDMRAFYRA
jgi:hypothetical protein